MVPRASVLGNIPNITEIVVWGYWALSDPIDTIHMHRVPLPNAVPVYTRSIVLEPVNDSDVDCLSSMLAHRHLKYSCCGDWANNVHRPSRLESKGPEIGC